MNKKEIEERIESLREEIERLETKKGKPGERWRAEGGGSFYVVSRAGEVELDSDIGCDTDNNLYRTGNYFKTIEEAAKSPQYFFVNSEYNYWIPGSGQPRPKGSVSGLQYHYGGCEWLYQGGPIDDDCLYRWPKSSHVEYE